MNNITLTQLITRCQEGDTHAVEWLVDEYWSTVYRLALTILEDGTENGAAEAEEATQDTFVAVLGALDSYRGEAAFTTWLYAIAINLCRDRLQKRRTRERLVQTLQALGSLWPFGKSRTAAPEEISLQNEANAVVRQAVNALGEKHRIPIILRYYHGCSVGEIAEVLGIDEGTVCSRLSNARDQLRPRLREVEQFTTKGAKGHKGGHV